MVYQPNFLGKFWSGFPANLDNGQINIVGGEETIAAAIVDICLTRKGEVPHHPTYGLSPELFASFNDIDIDYWTTLAYQEIFQGIPGLKELRIDLSASSEGDGKFSVSIEYSAQNSYDGRSAIVFPYSTYLGADYSTSLDEYLAGISINGESFTGIN